MKLLTKKESVALREKQKAHEINEGIRLNRQIESLRVVSIAETDSLNKFRDNFLRDFKRESTELQEKVIGLRNEVARLKQEKAEAQKPLDSEWEKLNNAKLLLTDEKEELDKQKEEINQKEQQIENDRQSVEIVKKDLIEKRIFVDGLISDAVQNEKETKEELKKATTFSTEANMLKLKMETEYARQQELFDQKEKAYEKRMDAYWSNVKSLNERELKLADRERTLERNIKRYANKNRTTAKG